MVGRRRFHRRPQGVPGTARRDRQTRVEFLAPGQPSSQRIQEGDQIRFLLGRQTDAEALIVKFDDIVERGS